VITLAPSPEPVDFVVDWQLDTQAGHDIELDLTEIVIQPSYAAGARGAEED
jgi:hypothetical protein